MGKKSDAEFEAMMAAIEKTKKLKSEIRASLGLSIEADISTMHPNDMYRFEYKRPDLESKNWIHLHGKCIDAGQKKFREWGYEFLQTGHYPQTDKNHSGIMCQHCKKRLDDKTYEKLRASKKVERERKHAEYLEEKAIREEWIAEQILLGKM